MLGFSIGLLGLGLMVGFWHWFSHKHYQHGIVCFHRSIWLLYAIYQFVWLGILFFAIPTIVQRAMSILDVAVILCVFNGLMIVGVSRSWVTVGWCISWTLIVTYGILLVLLVLSRGYLVIDDAFLAMIIVTALLIGLVVGALCAGVREKTVLKIKG